MSTSRRILSAYGIEVSQNPAVSKNSKETASKKLDCRIFYLNSGFQLLHITKCCSLCNPKINPSPTTHPPPKKKTWHPSCFENFSPSRPPDHRQTLASKKPHPVDPVKNWPLLPARGDCYISPPVDLGATLRKPPRKRAWIGGLEDGRFFKLTLVFLKNGGGGSTIDLTKADLLRFCCCRGWSLLRFMCIYCKKEVFNQKRLTVLYSLLFKVFSYAHTVFPKIDIHQGSWGYMFVELQLWRSDAMIFLF